MHIQEIRAFEKYYKIKWDYRYPSLIVRHCEEVVAKLKQAHQEKCAINFIAVSIKNPLARLKPF